MRQKTLETESRIETVLELARWAPSGDNTQPWRFEIMDDTTFVLHGSDTRDWCVYDLEGRPSQIALGALIENVVLVAADLGLKADIEHLADSPESAPRFLVRLDPDQLGAPDPLAQWIPHRVTQRRALTTRPLTDEVKSQLESAVGENYAIDWIEGSAGRWRMARLLFSSAKIRLTIPEAYQVHRRIIEWDATESPDRIPDKAVGLDPLGLKLMRWAMQSWSRVDFLNRYLAGTLLPRVQLDLVPAMRCGAHFILRAHTPPTTLQDYVNAGRAMQRLWLQATALGLQYQPEMTPLIFAWYADRGIAFSGREAAVQAASTIKEALPAGTAQHGVFMGRMGYGRGPRSRSIRLTVKQLLLNRNQ